MANYRIESGSFRKLTEGITVGSDPEVALVIQAPMEDENHVPYRKTVVVSPALLEMTGALVNMNDDPEDTRSDAEKLKHPYFLKTAEYMWQMDGVAMELTYRKPYRNVMDLGDVFKAALSDLRQRGLKKKSYKGQYIRAIAQPVVSILPEMYTPLLDDEKVYQGFIFGCDPDEDAILPDYVCSTVDVSTHPYRYFGGHIHIGHMDDDISNAFKKLVRPFVRLLACTVGVYCIAHTSNPEEERLRALQYGRPGRFRTQKWGLEYRTPSVSWLNLPNYELYGLDNAIRSAVYYLMNPSIGKKVIDDCLDASIDAIQTADRGTAMRVVRNTCVGY
jgi:hypothetical protein